MSEERVEEVSMKDMMEALDKSILRIHSGDVVKGKVISVTENEIFVNIGYMADGVMTREELTDDETAILIDIIKPGDEIDVYIIEVNDGEGNVALSKIRAEGIKVWDEFRESLEKGTTLNVKVSEIVKGGALAYVKGVRAFIPASQLSTRYVENLNDYLGKMLAVKVIELDEEKERVVLSAREVEKAEGELKKEEIWNSLKKGEKRTGVVSRLAKFGAFVDLGGVDGLIHISDLSWKRVLDPSEIVSVGDKVEVYIIDFDKNKGRISLGLKEVSQNPWNIGVSKYKVGNIVEGTIVRLVDFGAFVQIESGIEGLVHISQISEERIAKPSAVLKVGDKVKVKILDINEAEARMSLSIKDAKEESSEDFSQYNNNEDSITISDLLKEKLKGFKFEE